MCELLVPMDPSRFQDGLTSPSRHLLTTMIIDANQPLPSSLLIVADRALLLHEAEAVVFQQANQFVELHAAPLAAATTFFAASVSPSAVMILRPLSSSSFLPASTFVPSSRTTKGTRKSI